MSKYPKGNNTHICKECGRTPWIADAYLVALAQALLYAL